MLCGPANANLKLIERSAKIALHVRGNEITLDGSSDAVGTVRGTIEALYADAAAGMELAADEILRAIHEHAKPGEPQEERGHAIVTLRSGRPLMPKGNVQAAYVKLARENDITFALGPAGTGKTYVAVGLAARALLAREVRRIVLTRPAIEAGERLGFLPGTLEEKIDPYLRPLYDALADIFEPDKLSRMMSEKTIEIAPLAFMRGRTLNDAFILLDEAQNTSPEQMKMFLTRLGFGGRAIITGDPSQTDLPRGMRSGLVDATRLVEGIPGIGIVRFSDVDVVRHPLVAAIIRAYDARERARQESSLATVEAD